MRGTLQWLLYTMTEYFEGQDIECEPLTQGMLHKMQRQISDVLEKRIRLLDSPCAQINDSLWTIRKTCKSPYYPLKAFNYLLMSELLIDFINSLDMNQLQFQKMRSICSLRIHQMIKVKAKHRLSKNSSFEKNDEQRQRDFFGINKNSYKQSFSKVYQQTITKLKKFIQRLERANIELQEQIRQQDSEKKQFVAKINRVLDDSKDWSSFEDKSNNLKDRCKAQSGNPYKNRMEAMQTEIQFNRRKEKRLKQELMQSKRQQARLRQIIQSLFDENKKRLSSYDY